MERSRKQNHSLTEVHSRSDKLPSIHEQARQVQASQRGPGRHGVAVAVALKLGLQEAAAQVPGVVPVHRDALTRVIWSGVVKDEGGSGEYHTRKRSISESEVETESNINQAKEASKHCAESAQAWLTFATQHTSTP